MGYATPDGTALYSERSSHVHPSSFKKVDDLTLSKLVYGTNNNGQGPISDFFSYLALRYALLSGGINQIITGHSDRMHSAEYTVGKVL